MNGKIGLLCALLPACAFADENTLYSNNFDHYGCTPDAFNAVCSIREEPAGLKSLGIRPENQKSVNIWKQNIAVDPGAADWSFSFRFQFLRGEERKNFGIVLQFTGKVDGKSRRQAIDVALSDVGSHIRGMLEPSRLGTIKPTDPLTPILENQWHQAEIRYSGGVLWLFTDRNGTMEEEACAQIGKTGVRLSGFNLFTACPLEVDDIELKKLADSAPVVPEITEFELGKPLDLSLRGNLPLARFDLIFETESGKPLRYRIFGTAQEYRKTVMREETEIRDGKPVKVKKTANENVKIPNSMMRIQGPGVNESVYSQPRLQWRYTQRQHPAIIRDMKPENDFFRRTWQFHVEDRQVWLDGSLLFTLPEPVKKLSVAASPKASVAARPGTVWNRADGIISPDLSLNPHPGALADWTYLGKPIGPRSLDTGLCRENQGSFYLECDGFLSRSPFDAMSSSLLFRVPRAQYFRARVLCTFDGSPAKLSELTVRLTQFRSNGGITPAAFAQQTRVLPRSEKEACPAGMKRVGEAVSPDGKRKLPVYEVTFDLPAGRIQDLILDETRNWIDLDILGGLYKKDNFYLSRADKPSLTPSGVVVLGVELEKTPIRFTVENGALANTFYPADTPKVILHADADRKTSGRAEWSVTDIDGKVVETGARDFSFDGKGGEQTFPVNFSVKTPGWYGATFLLKDAAGNPLVRYDGSFTLLAEDTRKATYENSPYFIWNFMGAHYTMSDLGQVGRFMKMMGVRKGLLGRNYGEKDAAEFGLTLGQFPYLRVQGKTPEEIDRKLDEQIQSYLKRFPHTKQALIFHESGGGPLPMELYGGKTEITPEQKKLDQARVKQAMTLARAWRRNAPDVQLVIGNSGDSLGLLAQLYREKFPADLIDRAGEETVGETMPPERSVAYPFWMLRELGRLYGYNVPPEACYEWKSRLIRHSSPRKHAAQKARDILIAHAYGCRLIPVCGSSEMGNSYYNTVWGEGACSRYPLLQPHPVLAATSVLTQTLDCAEFSRMIPTGSNTVYMEEFKRGNEFIYALWTARGVTDCELTFASPGAIVKTDLYGRTSNLNGASVRLEVSEEPVYLTGGSAAVKCAASLRRRYPWETPEKPGVVAASVTASEGWKLVLGEEPRLKFPFGLNSADRPGKYTLQSVRDDEKGECLEVTLVPEGELSPLWREYAFLRLPEAKPIAGTPDTLGLWVKGNSGWGKIYFEIEDADGETWITAGTGGYGCAVYDWPEQMGVNFDSWHYLRFPLTANSPVKVASPGENQWQWQCDRKGDGKLTFPVKLKGIGFSTYRKVLNILEMEDVKDLSLRFRDFTAE